MTAQRLDEQTLAAWTDGSSEAVRAIAFATRGLVLDVLPDVDETADRGGNGIGFGANQYGADGWGVAAISIHRDWVNLGFMRGAQLPDPEGLLEGTGANMRHVKIGSLEFLEQRRSPLAALIRTAAGLPEHASG